MLRTAILPLRIMCNSSTEVTVVSEVRPHGSPCFHYAPAMLLFHLFAHIQCDLVTGVPPTLRKMTTLCLLPEMQLRAGLRVKNHFHSTLMKTEKEANLIQIIIQKYRVVKKIRKNEGCAACLSV
jgi:hypothetical protein